MIQIAIMGFGTVGTGGFSVLNRLQKLRLALFGVLIHRTELVHFEYSSVFTDSFLLENKRSGGFDKQGNCNNCNNRYAQDNSDNRKNDVNKSFQRKL